MLDQRDVRFIAEVLAERKSVSFDKKSTSTADEGDSEALVG